MVLGAVLLGLQCGGCQSSPAAIEPVVLEDYQRFCVVQNRRAELFEILESSGTVELRQTDADGTSFDSCNLNLWRDDRDFALRLKKFGERFLWVGSDGNDWWVFELAAEPSRLVVLPIDVQGAMNLGTQESLLGPRKLLQLSGLLPLDPGATLAVLDSTAEGLIGFELTSEVPGEWGRMRWEVDPQRLLPRRITALEPDGSVRFTATLDGYEPIPARDLPIGGWPQFARKVRIKDGAGTTDVRLYFNKPNARGDRTRPSLFDLQQLINTFKPAKVEYIAD
ncbi:MAG: hypothetical protein VX641_02520 [Planctomycetota bacterium]|nr:hypothetical protein [Planctomycetota bacterium]